ncbi:MAG: hypothetical protein IT442_10620, partial [Phycisphaeraceae bacterium]|nr:hypothetical protein [Phycisphaeraceae bacterium]
IDTLILTSPTLEHLSAVIDLAQRITIREAWISPQIAADLEATTESWSSPARLVLAELHRQGIPIKIIQPDQETTWPSVQLRVLASSPDPSSAHADDDTPIALRLQLADRTILLGDGWPTLMTAASDVAPSPVVLAEWPRRTSSRADLADWLRRNPPAVVLRQGTPPAYESLYWQPIWADLGITELTPHHHGAIQVMLSADGPPRWTTFLPPDHLDPDDPEALADQDDPAPASPEN